MATSPASRASDFADALEVELAHRVRPHIPADTPQPSGWVRSMLESWDIEADLVEAVEFVAVSFLDELQEDVILMLHSGWPIDADTGELASPYAVVDDKTGTLHVSFECQGRTVLSFEPINLRKLLGPEGLGSS